MDTGSLRNGLPLAFYQVDPDVAGDLLLTKVPVPLPAGPLEVRVQIR